MNTHATPPARRATASTGWLTALLGLLLTAALLTGCVPHFKDYEAYSLVDVSRYSEENIYVIQPPDVVRIIAPNTPELHNIVQVVRPDGRITLYPLGDFLAAGLSPVQLSRVLEESAKQVYLDVEIQVQIVSSNSKVIYVMGQVGRQGPQPFEGTESFLHAMARAVPLTTAWPQKVQVHRRDRETGEVHSVTLNYQEMVSQGELAQNFALREGDIIFVPPNPFAAVGFAIQNLIFPVDPALRAVGAPGAAVRATDISDRSGGYGY